MVNTVKLDSGLTQRRKANPHQKTANNYVYTRVAMIYFSISTVSIFSWARAHKSQNVKLP